MSENALVTIDGREIIAPIETITPRADRPDSVHFSDMSFCLQWNFDTLANQTKSSSGLMDLEKNKIHRTVIRNSRIGGSY
jgi:hypothetical protein